MSSMVLTNIHLTPEQRRALQARAKANKTNVAEEVRLAVDSYLSGVTPAELSMLDAATRHAESMLTDMAATLDAINQKAAATFAELAALRGGSGPGA